MTQFILAYEHAGYTFTCRVDATTFADAQRHLIALASTGRVSGEYVCDVPEVDDTALLRQALETLELSLEAGPTKIRMDAAIAALRERLGETK